MTITATIRQAAIDMPCYVTESYDASTMLSRFEDVETLRSSINEAVQGEAQMFTDSDGNLWDWTDAHWTAFASALQSDIDDVDLRETHCAIADIENANGGTDYDELTEEFDDQTYVYFSIEFEDDGIPDDTDRFTFRTVDALGVFASALINGDLSGLDDSDIQYVNLINDEYGSPFTCSTVGFKTCEISGLAGDCERYVFMYPRIHCEITVSAHDVDNENVRSGVADFGDGVKGKFTIKNGICLVWNESTGTILDNRYVAAVEAILPVLPEFKGTFDPST